MRIKLCDGAYMPVRAHKTDAGLDLRSPIDVFVPAKEAVCIDTAVCVELPKNTVGMVKSKSGLNVNNGLQCEGVIDVGYTGSIRVKLYNHSSLNYFVRRGDKIAQLVIMPILTPDLEMVDELDETERGANGFGSTGR